MSHSLPLFDSSMWPDVSGHVAELLASVRPADAGHHDELRNAEGRMRPAWTQFVSHAGGSGSDLAQRHAELEQQIREDGITYNIYSSTDGPARPWSLELLPMLIEPADWQGIEQGIRQRAQLLNRMACDVYGEQKLLKQALLPASIVLGHPTYLRGLKGSRPPADIYLHVIAFDLVRAHDGQWWVVSQRTQAPSGLGYVMQNRRIISRLFPEAFRSLRVQHLASSYRRLLDTLHALAEPCAEGQSPRLALWTPGPYNETYFEHAYLARYLGLPLVEGGDLIVRDERVYLKTVQGLEPIHGLLRRLDDDFCDPLELRPDSTLGVPGLLQAIRRGNVVVSNALGTGFLESPAIHGFLPGLCEHLLGAPLQLPSVPTWWCGEAAAWRAVSSQIHQKVLRPTFPAVRAVGAPGAQHRHMRAYFETVLGPALSAQERQKWRERIEQDPAAYTAQDFLAYAQTPVWTPDARGGSLAMREASLRVYALADGQGGWQVLPGGMTRTATREAGPVSMQFGGSSLDTWVLTEGSVDTYSMLTQTIRPEEFQRQRPVASRAGENLFWMGRYTERAEQQSRLVDALAGLLGDDSENHAPLLEAMSALATSFGLVPAGTPTLVQSARVFERALLESLTDAKASQGAYSLSYNLGALERGAQVLRDRLSGEHDRLLRALSPDFQARCHKGSPKVPALPDVRDALSNLAMQLAAVTGAQTDRMTRDAGWRLLTVGRLIERLSGYTEVLGTFTREGAWKEPAGFDLLMSLFDSQITFRARFQRRLEWGALVATVVTDEANPRALACALRRLRTELSKLPEHAGPLTGLLDLLPQSGVGVPMETLLHPVDGPVAVAALCERLTHASWRLSDEVGLRFFVHAEPSAQMFSV